MTAKPDKQQIIDRLTSILNTKPITQPQNTTEYKGSCHCKQLQYTIYLTQQQHNNILNCNCTICTKKQFLHCIVPSTQFQLTHGSVNDAMIYTFGSHQAIHCFCNICGIHCFYIAKSHPNDIDCNLYCLDDIDITKFSTVQFDGRDYDNALQQLNGNTTDNTKQFDYNLVLTRELADTFVSALCMSQPTNPIDLQLAHQQHTQYIDLLKSIVPNVAVLPADDRYPDCNYIEDTVTVVNNIIIFGNMAAKTRHGEQQVVRRYLEKTVTNSIIVDLDSTARFDGGDILFTGTHLFVGITKRTNYNAYLQMKQILAEHKSTVTVHNIYVTAGLHLKSVISVLDAHTLIRADNECAYNVQQQINSFTDQYQYVVVPDIEACNILRLYNSIVIQDGFPQSEKILRKAAEQRRLTVHQLNMSELIKADGALTCGSVLMHI